jgi:signal transduction histidine kinase
MSRARHAYAVQLARREILARLSHELRTPLNAVIGFSGLLRTNRAGNQRPQDVAMLESIRASGERLLDLVEDLFELTTTGQKGAVVMAPVNVAEIAAAAIQSRIEDAIAKGITVDLHVQAEAPVVLDADRLLRLLRKLVCNAVKFTERGGVVITVVRRAETDRPGSIVVEDSGIGIHAELQASIFQAFTQADGSERRAYEGAGLGLHIANVLAKSMGCRLTCESDVGIGSRFTVELPE